MAEEAEDGVYDNWEDLVDTGALDKKLAIMKPNIPDHCSNCLSTLDSYDGVSPVIIQDDGHRTPFIPPQPQVKILKRPTGVKNKSEGSVTVNGEKLQKQPVKTLQQREAAYAEARLRILGAAKSDEEVAEERLTKLTLAASAESYRSEEPRCLNNPVLDNVRLLNAMPTVEIIRAPRGPDDTNGFAQFR